MLALALALRLQALALALCLQALLTSLAVPLVGGAIRFANLWWNGLVYVVQTTMIIVLWSLTKTTYQFKTHCNGDSSKTAKGHIILRGLTIKHR